jgi:signal transduction histidine kinase
MNLVITDRKRQEEELRESEQRWRNLILGMTELALDTPLTPDQHRYLATLKTAADSLLVIIEDLLDVSKIEAGQVELDPVDFSLRLVLGETLKTLAARAHKKGLERASDVWPDVPDPSAMASGLGNTLPWRRGGAAIE